MKKLFFTFAVLALVSCQDSQDFTDIPNHNDSPFSELVAEQNGEFDKEALAQQMQESAFVYDSAYMYTDEKWEVPYPIGAPTHYGFIIDENVMKIYISTNDFIEEKYYVKSYDCRYDAETSTIYTVYNVDGKEYPAEVVYYKDGVIVIEGFLPFNPPLEAPELIRYKGYFSDVEKAEWESSDRWIEN